MITKLNAKLFSLSSNSTTFFKHLGQRQELQSAQSSFSTTVEVDEALDDEDALEVLESLLEGPVMRGAGI